MTRLGRPDLLIVVLLALSQPPVSAAGAASTAPDANVTGTLLLVIGAAGEDEFEKQFSDWSDQWESAARRGNVEVTRIGRADEDPQTDRDRLRATLEAAQAERARPLWIVLIGHGTYDGRDARFNLRGPDVTDRELEEWLAPLARPLAFINCTSASAPYLPRLSRPGRIVITATKAGSELNFARFGRFLAEAIGDAAADLDKDQQVSLFEAFLMASRRTEEWYATEGQLATEHALLDDNGDGQGVRADFFSGIRPTESPEGGAALDGHRAHQWHLIPGAEERRFPDELRRRRNELELAVLQLRDQKASLEEAEYFTQLETLLVELARLYQQADRISSSSGPLSNDQSPAEAARPEATESPAAPADTDARTGDGSVSP